MSKLLILTDWFAPGYKAGGPIRSCVNLARVMKEHFQVFVLTADTDEGETIPYEGIPTNQWVPFEDNIKVYYLSAAKRELAHIKKIILALQPHFIYLNSMFSKVFTLFPLILHWQKKLGDPKVILTPRGMLHAGALQYKSSKKKIFLFLFRLLKMEKILFFQATDEQEAIDIEYHLGTSKEKITFLENFPDIGSAPKSQRLKKEEAELSLVFISRVAAKKNLDFLLECLQEIPTDISVRLSLYGPIESRPYWQRCMDLIANLPKTIQVTHKGSIKHEEVRMTLQKHHFFILLTHGENFGHAIFEAFAAGIPVILSDQTPWRELKEKNIGWDLPLSNKSAILQSIIQAAQMDNEQYLIMSRAARLFAEQYISEKKLTERYLELFKV